MVSPRWMMLILVLFLFGATLSAIIEQSWLSSSATSNVTSQMSSLLDEKTTIWDKAFIAWDMSWFDFAMFKNPDGTANALVPIRWCLMILSISFWFTVFMGIGQGVVGIVQRLVGLG